MQLTKKQYAQFVKKRSDPTSTAVNTIKAYITGGAICMGGQYLKTFYLSIGLSDPLSSTATSVTLIAIAAILTAAHVFDNIARFAGAGTLVPITGFANSVVSPAIEYKTEGFITGLAEKMFVIAGPVIVYGTATAVICGIAYYIFFI
ncbi:MAG: SpoVA/SpoVAEb family sporulation membrane protein [Clostridia bacterium]|nr:SpoVA/SpoVAEb family sporulation membrane protein [Clostridia bacterium]